MRKFFLSCVLLLACIPAAHGKLLTANQVTKQESLLPYFTWLADPEGRQTIESITSDSSQVRFTPIHRGIPLKEKGPIWLRLGLIKSPSVARGGAGSLSQLEMNMGQLPPGITRIYFAKPLAPDEKTPSLQQDYLSSFTDYRLPEPGLLPLSIYIRFDEMPDLWFAPTITPQDSLTAPFLPPDVLLPALLLIGIIGCLLRAMVYRAQWSLWAALFLGCVLVQAVLPLPGLRQGFELRDLPKLLAPGMALILLPHVGRCMFSSKPFSVLLDGMLFFASLLGLLLCLVPLMPNMSWVTRLFVLWPLLLIPLIPTCAALMAWKRPGAIAFSGACVMGIAGALVSFLAIDAPTFHPLAAQGSLWGLAVGGLGFVFARTPKRRAAKKKKRDAALDASAESTESDDTAAGLVMAGVSGAAASSLASDALLSFGAPEKETRGLELAPLEDAEASAATSAWNVEDSDGSTEVEEQEANRAPLPDLVPATPSATGDTRDIFTKLSDDADASALDLLSYDTIPILPTRDEYRPNRSIPDAFIPDAEPLAAEVASSEDEQEAEAAYAASVPVRSVKEDDIPEDATEQPEKAVAHDAKEQDLLRDDSVAHTGLSDDTIADADSDTPLSAASVADTHTDDAQQLEQVVLAEEQAFDPDRVGLGASKDAQEIRTAASDEHANTEHTVAPATQEEFVAHADASPETPLVITDADDNVASAGHDLIEPQEQSAVLSPAEISESAPAQDVSGVVSMPNALNDGAAELQVQPEQEELTSSYADPASKALAEELLSPAILEAAAAASVLVAKERAAQDAAAGDPSISKAVWDVFNAAPTWQPASEASGENGVAQDQNEAAHASEQGYASAFADDGTPAWHTDEHTDPTVRYADDDNWRSEGYKQEIQRGVAEDSLVGVVPDFAGSSDALTEPVPATGRPVSLAEGDFVTTYSRTAMEELKSGARQRPQEVTETSFMFSLYSLVREVHDVVSPLAKQKGLVFSWYIAPTLPSLLEGDAASLRSALSLLLQNAVQATDEGAVQLAVRRNPMDVDTGHLLFAVNDSGSAQRTDAGFFHAWELAARTGGSFNVEYSPIGGTEIIFTVKFGVATEGQVGPQDDDDVWSQESLVADRYVEEDTEEDLIPVLHSAPSVTDEEDAIQNDTSNTLSKGSEGVQPETPAVLLAETDATYAHEQQHQGKQQPVVEEYTGVARIIVAEMTTSNRRLLAHYLSEFPHENLVANSNAQVVTHFQTQPIAMVIFDADMPEPNIIKTITTLRREEDVRGIAATPILVLTSHEAQSQRMLAAGCTHTLCKPFAQSALRSILLQSIVSFSAFVATAEAAKREDIISSGDPFVEHLLTMGKRSISEKQALLQHEQATLDAKEKHAATVEGLLAGVKNDTEKHVATPAMPMVDRIVDAVMKQVAGMTPLQDRVPLVTQDIFARARSLAATKTTTVAPERPEAQAIWKQEAVHAAPAGDVPSMSYKSARTSLDDREQSIDLLAAALKGAPQAQGAPVEVQLPPRSKPAVSVSVQTVTAKKKPSFTVSAQVQPAVIVLHDDAAAQASVAEPSATAIVTATAQASPVAEKAAMSANNSHETAHAAVPEINIDNLDPDDPLAALFLGGKPAPIDVPAEIDQPLPPETDVSTATPATGHPKTAEKDTVAPMILGLSLEDVMPDDSARSGVSDAARESWEAAPVAKKAAKPKTAPAEKSTRVKKAPRRAKGKESEEAKKETLLETLVDDIAEQAAPKRETKQAKKDSAPANNDETCALIAQESDDAAPQSNVGNDGQTFPIAGYEEETLDIASLPLVPGLIHSLKTSLADAHQGVSVKQTILIQEATSRLAGKAEVFGLHRLAKIARCVERSAEANDLEASETLMEDLELMTKKYLEGLHECYESFLNIDR